MPTYSGTPQSCRHVICQTVKRQTNVSGTHTAQHAPPPNIIQAIIYAQAKTQTTKYLREETRIRIRRNRVSPIAEIKNKIDELAFFIASESDNAPPFAKKKALIDQLEALNKAPKNDPNTQRSNLNDTKRTVLKNSSQVLTN
jgi:hypothetical protein